MLIPFIDCKLNKQNNETQLWHQIYTHKIVHSSAMYYHNLHVIRKGSKKLLTIKNSKGFF